MIADTTALAKLDKAVTWLAEARTLDEVKRIVDIAEAARTYARAAKLGLEAYNHAAEVKVRAERKAGEMLRQLERGSGPGRGNKTNSNMENVLSEYREVLTDNEIPNTTAHRWQQLAEMPEQVFEQHIEETRGERPITTNGIIQDIKRAKTQVTTLEPAIRPPKYEVEDGQVWHLGRHILVCGDAYQLIGNMKAEALISDPPYGIDYKPDWNKWDGSASDFKPVYGDDQEFDPAPFMNFPTVLLFGANYYSNRLPLGGWLCWDKRTKEELDEMFGSPFELAWYRSVNTTRKAIMVRLLHGGVVNADSVNGNNEKRYHATQKPVALMERVIKELTLEGDTVADAFAGSGSTLLACERSNRNCIAIEIDPGNAAIILQRWTDETGGVPCLE